MQQEAYQYLPAFAADRRLFSGCDEQGTGCEEEQPHFCAGGGQPETAGCDQQGIDRRSHSKRRSAGIRGRLDAGQAVLYAGASHRDRGRYQGDRRAFQ